MRWAGTERWPGLARRTTRQPNWQGTKAARSEGTQKGERLGLADSLGGPRAKIAESRAIELARLIHADTSPLALKPHNDGVIIALCRASIAGAEASVASSTALKDDLAWTRWETYCLSMNTPAFRSDIRANAGIDYVGAQRESLLLVGFMIHCAATISSYGGKGACKPQTALDMVLALKRIHKRLGVPIGCFAVGAQHVSRTRQAVR